MSKCKQIDCFCREWSFLNRHDRSLVEYNCVWILYMKKNFVFILVFFSFSFSKSSISFSLLMILTYSVSLTFDWIELFETWSNKLLLFLSSKSFTDWNKYSNRSLFIDFDDEIIVSMIDFLNVKKTSLKTTFCLIIIFYWLKASLRFLNLIYLIYRSIFCLIWASWTFWHKLFNNFFVQCHTNDQDLK